MFNPQEVKKDFPILSQPHPSGKPLVYLDSAATSQKPTVVIDAIAAYYTTSNANVHRGIHYLGDVSTRVWHDSRTTIASFFGADAEELVLVRNTTEALNFVAYSYLEPKLNANDVLISTEMEHHSNLVPWQELARRTGARLELIPITRDGQLDLSWFSEHVARHGNQIKAVCVSHISNTLGTVNSIVKIAKIVKASNPVFIVDGAQAAAHLPINFHTLPVDFYAVSSHKMLGPMGVGAVLVKRKLLETMSPWFFGGGMIDEVDINKATFSPALEERFTAGTPDVAGVVGWAAACDYLSDLGMQAVYAHDQRLVRYAMEKLSNVPQVKVIGPDVSARSGSVAFVYDGVHAHDVAQILDSEGIAVRSGHHCCMPLHTKMGWQATTRASFSVYTTQSDIDRLVEGLKKVENIFGS